MKRRRLVSGLILCGAALLPSCHAADKPDLPPTEAGYLREHVYDTTVHPDDALTNVRVAFNRWPDCTTLESAVNDIFRLEGVADKSDQDKALALWKWWRILVSATGGSYAFELKSEGGLCRDPHKIFAVYGHHQCDGQSWAMVSLWRAAGYLALDQCHWGHTIASLRYKDRDGKYRFHDLDPQGRFYWWDEKNGWIGTWTNPIMQVKVHRHVMQPQRVHSLRTSLRIGETLERKWENAGHVVPSGRDKLKAFGSRYYQYPPKGTGNVYAAVGEEVQTLEAGLRNLFTGSQNTAATGGLLHPKVAGAPGVFIWRMAPPYVAADARIKATLVKGDPRDVCRLAISTDGRKWTPVFEKTTAGEEKVEVNIGLDAWKKNRPNVFTAYTFFVKTEVQTANGPTSVGAKALQITANRMLNKRTLPHLRPGENVVRVTADTIRDDVFLELRIDYKVNGKPAKMVRFVRRFPHYFRINVPKVPERVLKNYDKHWNDGAVQMTAINLGLVPVGAPAVMHPSLDRAKAQGKFEIAAPHPADMTRRRICKKSETDVRQTNGFFPQAGPGTLDDDAKMKELIGYLNKGRVHRNLGRQWLAAEQLGDYPKAVDALLEALPPANIDLTLFICKALARNPDRTMIGPLLRKWERAPRGSPGTRYIPDVLAAIGDRSVVPALVARLKHCRFDHRFHIAHALGILGGPAAETALEDLATNDPFKAVREEAERARKALRIKRDPKQAAGK